MRAPLKLTRQEQEEEFEEGGKIRIRMQRMRLEIRIHGKHKIPNCNLKAIWNCAIAKLDSELKLGAGFSIGFK